MVRRVTKTLEGLGLLVPYRWGSGWVVRPAQGGLRHAQAHGMGVARDLKEGREFLAALAQLEVAQ